MLAVVGDHMNNIEHWDIKKSKGGFLWIYHKHIYKDLPGRKLEQATDLGECCTCGMPAPPRYIEMVNMVNYLDGYSYLHISESNKPPHYYPTTHYDCVCPDDQNR